MKEKIKIIDAKDYISLNKENRKRFPGIYYSMYSSFLGGIVLDPYLMLVPVDDHLVHRGDGVFETFKCIKGYIYNLDAHLRRLNYSARKLSLKILYEEEQLKDIIIQTILAGGKEDCLVRLLISRGPGGLGVDPYECPESGVYIIVSPLKINKNKVNGVKIKTSAVELKPDYLATIKCCNYIPNVLMKKEAVDNNVDFVIGIDKEGNIAESATENIAILTKDGGLAAPRNTHILEGTTLGRVFILAKDLVEEKIISSVKRRDISLTEAKQALEVYIIGTTPDIMPVIQWDETTISNGIVGNIYKRLAELLENDIISNNFIRTKVF